MRRKGIMGESQTLTSDQPSVLVLTLSFRKERVGA